MAKRYIVENNETHKEFDTISEVREFVDTQVSDDAVEDYITDSYGSDMVDWFGKVERGVLIHALCNYFSDAGGSYPTWGQYRDDYVDNCMDGLKWDLHYTGRAYIFGYDVTDSEFIED